MNSPTHTATVPLLHLAAFALSAGQVVASLTFSNPTAGAPGGTWGNVPGSTASWMYDIASPFVINQGSAGSYTGTWANSSFTYGDSSLTGPYSGPGYGGQNGFFNQLPGSGGLSNPSVGMSIEIQGDLGDPGDVRHRLNNIGSGSNEYYDLQLRGDQAVEKVTFTYTFKGDPNYFMPGITGLWSSPTSQRPLLAAGLFDNFGHQVNAMVTGVGNPSWITGGAQTNAIFQAADFYANGVVPFPGNTGGNPFNDLGTPTITGGGTGANFVLDRDNATATDGRAFWFHNQTDLGDVVNSVQVMFTPVGQSTFNNGRFRFSFDGMAPTIPEPSRAVLLLGGFAALLLRRRR